MQPIKPTRRKKESASGCGLLVSVIKTLDASETSEQRDHEKQKIEKEFKKSDQKLNQLVSTHDVDLTQVMQLFGKVSTQISSSRERIHTVKANLQDCKQLLRCRREELKKLWMDAVQNKYLLDMLDQVNDLQKISAQINGHLAKKHYLHATKTLVTALNISEGQLKGVEGLADLRNDFSNKRQMLYTRLIEELNKHLYQTSTQELLSFQRQNSTSKGSAYTSPFQRTTVLRKSAERIEANSKAKKALFDISQNGYIDVDKSEIIDDTDLLDPDINSTYFIGIIVECFALLQKVPDSIETIKVQMQHELLAIVGHTTQHLMVTGGNEADGQTTAASKLLELLELLFKQFKLIADAHALTIRNFGSVIKRNGLQQCRPYEISDFWSQVQAVFQLVLTDYLDIQNMAAAADDQLRTSTASTFPEATLNVNTFFNRRKLQGKKTLFKFDKSSHSEPKRVEDVVPTTVKEHRRNLSNASASKEEGAIVGPSAVHTKFGGAGVDGRKAKREKVLICAPDQSLVRAVYLPMMKYVQEIEQLMKAKTGQPSTLNAFLTNYVKETFLARGHSRSLQLTVESLSKTQDAWRSIINPDEMKRYGLSRPLLQSTVLVENKISETKKLIQDLPNYSDDLLKMVCSLLKTYRENCQAAYRGIVQPETEDKRIYSVTWLKDDDISRFLKTLPNWTDLKSAKTKSRRLKSEPSEEESPTQVQQRNIREAEMLTSNLGEGGISQQEILSDIGVLKELAILQESMEWFANRITDFANDLRNPIVNGLAGSPELVAPVEIKGGTIKVLSNLALEFDELANTCLLVLHLEVRVQCFHYLRLNPLDKQKSYNKADSLEPDSRVLRLTKILSDMDEALNATLHPRKTKYVFEGLAHLAARILIMAANYMETIDTAGIQRMCRNANAMQQTLSSITASREVSLDQARNFYEMFYMNPDDFLNSIVEKGPQFTEMQYLNALQLICKSHGVTDSNSLLTYQQRLSDILGTKTAVGIMV